MASVLKRGAIEFLIGTDSSVRDNEGNKEIREFMAVLLGHFECVRVSVSLGSFESLLYPDKLPSLLPLSTSLA
jgi:hypothetical protein